MHDAPVTIVGEHWRVVGWERRWSPSTGRGGAVYHGIVLILIPQPDQKTHERRLRLLCRPRQYAADLPDTSPPDGANVCGRCRTLLHLGRPTPR